MGIGYKSRFQEANKALRQKDEEIKVLQGKLSELQTEKIDLETEIERLKSNIVKLEATIEELEEKNTQVNEQLRSMELSRFASAYKDQENEYKTQQDLWFKLSLGATALLTISVLISIFGPHVYPRAEWFKEPAFYLLDVIFLTLFVYALKHHSHLGNLRIDYANRKTLAQSYQYIIEDEEETSEVRKRFLERAADIFSSKAILRSEDVTVYEAVVAKLLGRNKE